MAKQKVTLWRRKGSKLYAPATPEYMTILENGDVEDKTTALGEKGDDVKGIQESYEKLDKILEKKGLENRFTQWLLPNYEPVVVEMNEDEFNKWEEIFEDY